MSYISQLNIVISFLFAALNIFCLYLISLDKKRAVRHHWRIPEKIFFILAFAGGAVGTYLGMIFFRHKTKHFHFKWGMRLLVVFHGVVFYFLFYNT
ncbi:MAG: DUF1294 domain-containing protein [Bacillota bacterium]|nr:DUF1294 domain-containing protein [Bacillota bacterium]